MHVFQEFTESMEINIDVIRSLGQDEFIRDTTMDAVILCLGKYSVVVSIK